MDNRIEKLEKMSNEMTLGNYLAYSWIICDILSFNKKLYRYCQVYYYGKRAFNGILEELKNNIQAINENYGWDLVENDLPEITESLQAIMRFSNMFKVFDEIACETDLNTLLINLE